MRRRRETSPLAPWAALAAPLCVAVTALALAVGTDDLNAGRSAEAKSRLEDAIRRGCVACYAAEGSYPQSLDVLTQRYGLQIDEGRYAVAYRPFGPNLMPHFAVLERKP